VTPVGSARLTSIQQVVSRSCVEIVITLRRIQMHTATGFWSLPPAMPSTADSWPNSNAESCYPISRGKLPKSCRRTAVRDRLGSTHCRVGTSVAFSSPDYVRARLLPRAPKPVYLGQSVTKTAGPGRPDLSKLSYCLLAVALSRG
jgi:hypothetical protein